MKGKIGCVGCLTAALLSVAVPAVAWGGDRSQGELPRQAFAFDPAACRIPEKFRDHPLFTEPVVGVNFGFGGRRGYYAAHMDEPAKMKAAGVNWCVLKIHPMQETFCSRKIFFDPVFTVGEEETANMVAELHRNGIHVMLQPCVMALDSSTMFNSFFFPGEEECQLEGRHPTYWKEWFASQREILTVLAEFAEKTGCEALIIGCEYEKTVMRTDDWLETLAAVRQRYHGPVSFERGGTGAYPWLDRLDFVCLSYYPPAAPMPVGGFVSAEQWNALPDVSREEMAKTLKATAVEPLRRLHEASGRLPVIITEAGMVGVHGWCREPWNGMLPHEKGVRVDHREQADYTDAVFETFVSQSYCRGICLWKWDEAQPRWFKRANPPIEGGFDIPGKPVENVLRKWAQLAQKECCLRSQAGRRKAIGL